MSKPKETTENNMILVEAGRFEMGKKSEAKLLMRITKDFYICKYPVTFVEYDEFCEDERKEKPNDKARGRGNRAVSNVSWYDAIEYCNWKSRKVGKEEVYKINKNVKDINSKSRTDKIKWTVTCDFWKKGYRLLTESEWEFAARGGNNSKNYIYSGSNEINEVAWYHNISDPITRPVGEKEPNELGIYDMSGNVFEWCWDWYSRNNSVVYDPKGAKAGFFRVYKGGGCYNYALTCEVAFRGYNTPSVSYINVGFRVSMSC